MSTLALCNAVVVEGEESGSSCEKLESVWCGVLLYEILERSVRYDGGLKCVWMCRAALHCGPASLLIADKSIAPRIFFFLFLFPLDYWVHQFRFLEPDLWSSSVSFFFPGLRVIFWLMTALCFTNEG